MSKALKKLRFHRVTSDCLYFGRTPSLHESKGFIREWIFVLFIGAVVGLLLGLFYENKFSMAIDVAEIGAATALIGYGVIPVFKTILMCIIDWRWPPNAFFRTFTIPERALSVIVIAWCLVFAGNHAIAAVMRIEENKSQPIAEHIKIPPHHKWHERHKQYHSQKAVFNHTENSNLPIKNPLTWIIAWLATVGLIVLAFHGLKYRSNRRLFSKASTLPFQLWLGRSTGLLSDLSHGSGLASKQKIALSLEDAAQNILVLGGIGSGKTTCAMHPFLIQFFDQNCGGLIFDIKGDFQKAVMKFSAQTQRTVTTIGPGFEKMNLLAGLTPEVAASFLKSAFLLGNKSLGDGFWIDTAAELCRNTLGVLSFLPRHYSLQGLYRYLFNEEDRLAIDRELNTILPSLDEKRSRLMDAYWQYQERIFDSFDSKVKAGVYATIAQVLSPFNHPELVEAFCSMNENHVPMEAVLDGAVYLVSLPLSVWGLGGKVVYSLIKLRFYNVMQQRSTQPAWNQGRPVFFMCDEFQEIVSASKDGLSDLNFWDKSRSSKTIGVISAQAISSFYASIGDRDITHALLQNFRQKICFKTEDTSTLHYFHHLADKVETVRKSYSESSSSQSHSGTFSGGTSTSSSVNTAFVEKSLLNPQLFRKLRPGEAIALLSILGHSADDVIGMMAVFV